MIQKFAERLHAELITLPGPQAQEKMAPEHRLPHDQWKRYYSNAKLGAVLILFYPHADSIHTILIQRPKYEGVHSGQVAFPGGAKEKQDEDLISTALREAHEEVGIEPNKVKVIGPLSELYIPPSNFLITPVVSVAESRPDFLLQPSEVAGILEVPVEVLLDETVISKKHIRITGDFSIESPYYDIEGNTVWGATAMMISELNEILRKVI